jgi:hypothetical protein
MVIGYGWDDKEEIEVGMNKEKYMCDVMSNEKENK